MQKLTFLTYVGLTAGLLVAVTGMRPPKALGPDSRPGTDKLEWLTFQQAQEKAKDHPRVILMDMYTDWCYWCKVMDLNTYSNSQLSAYLEDKFYTVKFNAESKASVSWKGKSFEYNADYRVNDLALALTQGKLSYPTTVIFTPDDHAPQYLAGYLKPSDLEPVLKYFGEGAYKTLSYKDFKKSFVASWK